MSSMTRNSQLVDLAGPVARLWVEPGRPHLEWLQLFTPDGEHVTLQRDHAVLLGRALRAAYGDE